MAAERLSDAYKRREDAQRLLALSTHLLLRNPLEEDLPLTQPVRDVLQRNIAQQEKSLQHSSQGSQHSSQLSQGRQHSSQGRKHSSQGRQQPLGFQQPPILQHSSQDLQYSSQGLQRHSSGLPGLHQPLGLQQPPSLHHLQQPPSLQQPPAKTDPGRSGGSDARLSRRVSVSGSQRRQQGEGRPAGSEFSAASPPSARRNTASQAPHTADSRLPGRAQGPPPSTDPVSSMNHASSAQGAQRRTAPASSAHSLPVEDPSQTLQGWAPLHPSAAAFGAPQRVPTAYRTPGFSVSGQPVGGQRLWRPTAATWSAEK